VVADNQVRPAAAAGALGFVDVVTAPVGPDDGAGADTAARDIGRAAAELWADIPRQAAMARAARAAVDGRGADRAAEALAELLTTRKD